MTTDTRSKDTIRDAFEAMLAFFAFLFTRKRVEDRNAAIEIGENAADQVDITHPHSGLPVRALRDLIQRAAEEHAQIEGCDVCGRTPTTSGSEDGEQRHVCAEHGGDWTPERIAEALERCERAPEGPWGVFEQDCLCWITGPTRIIGDEGEMSRTVATFIAATRAGYPSALRALQTALGEIDRLTNANANHKALLAAAESAGRDVCNERDEARRDRDALALKVETMIEIETHARDLMRNANHHADADDRCNITVDSEPFNALHELFAPVFAAERKATRAAKKASR